jgi:hypothetical protein
MGRESIASVASVLTQVSDHAAQAENTEFDYTEGLGAKERRRILSSPYRSRLLAWICSDIYTKTILFFVFMHVSVLILSSIDQVVQPASIYLEVADVVILGILMYDCALKIAGWQRVIFTRFTLIVDLLLVVSDILVLVLPHIITTQTPTTKLVIRLLHTSRSIRLLWSISHIKNLSIIVNTLLKSSRYNHSV